MLKSRSLLRLSFVLYLSALAYGLATAQETPMASPQELQNVAPSTLSSSSKAESLDTLKRLSTMLSQESDVLVIESTQLKQQVSELLIQLDLSSIELAGLKSSLTDLRRWSESLQEMNSRTLEDIQKQLTDSIAAQQKVKRQRDVWRSSTFVSAGAAVGLAIAGPIGAAVGAASGLVIGIFISSL